MPVAGGLVPAPGDGHGDEGDALSQGPAQERNETLPGQPKPTKAMPTNAKPSQMMPANSGETFESQSSGAVVALGEAKPKLPGNLVTVRPKPEKRKNAKERAKAKYAKVKTEDGTTPMTATAKSKVETKAKTEAGTKAKKTKAVKAA
jgi:hypothetical protein